MNQQALHVYRPAVHEGLVHSNLLELARHMQAESGVCLHEGMKYLAACR